jgi:pyruvate,orthophosphate dikinase
MTRSPYIAFFAPHHVRPAAHDTSATPSPLLYGGKGAHLMSMAKEGLPIPPGFILTTDAFKDRPKNIGALLAEGLAFMEKHTGKQFGSADNPMLVSVRSGAPISMPGMMDTILNLGLTKDSAQQFITKDFGIGCYHRFLDMFAKVVMGKTPPANLTDLENLVTTPYPTLTHNPMTQLKLATSAVFDSWHTPRAKAYRVIHHIDEALGTAVVVQFMAFGHKDPQSCTGVLFTRNPSTGEKGLFGEYLPQAQGEDIVAGTHTPKNIVSGDDSLQKAFPTIFGDLKRVSDQLERFFGDMQDIEFTVESGKLFILQARSGKRTAKAALKIALDLLDDGIANEEQAIMSVDANNFTHLLHPVIDDTSNTQPIGQGLAASPGAAVGHVVFSPQEACAWKDAKVILIREETSPEDIEGMNAAQGIVTGCGGMTSHAAVVARGMGKPCICSLDDLWFDWENNQCFIGDVCLKQGDLITIDGSTGQLYKDGLPLTPPRLDDQFTRFMDLCDKHRTLSVRANAETPADLDKAFSFGAEGIGLCRTEHMFFERDRSLTMQQLILSPDQADKMALIPQLHIYQRTDFAALINKVQDRPLTVRLLDPPLHEFLPKSDQELDNLSPLMNLSTETLRERCAQLGEINPMLGHRGCRLGITYPAIYKMQVRALFEAFEDAAHTPALEIMIPFVMGAIEFNRLKDLITAAATDILSPAKQKAYKIGAMIEVPRAAIRADEIAQSADFFSFGTNDLTQMTLGLSRDDAARFMGLYADERVFVFDPFVHLDAIGVGVLMEMAIEKGRASKPDLKIGICGEHGGDPESIGFLATLGIDYVSCSPYRLPVARLAAAQAAIRHKQGNAIVKRRGVC